LQQLDPASCAYNMPAAVRVKGPLDPSALREALSGVASRHEVLRTRYAVVDGEPTQLIDPQPELPLPLIDLEALPAEAREATAWPSQRCSTPTTLPGSRPG